MPPLIKRTAGYSNARLTARMPSGGSRSPHGCSITAPVRADVRFSTAPFVCLEALGALSTLLDQVLKTTAQSSKTRLPSASRISRDQN